MGHSVQNEPLQEIHSGQEEIFHVLRPMLFQAFENIGQGGEEDVLAVMKASSTCVNPPWRFFLRESPNASSQENSVVLDSVNSMTETVRKSIHPTYIITMR